MPPQARQDLRCASGARLRPKHSLRESDIFFRPVVEPVQNSSTNFANSSAKIVEILANNPQILRVNL